MALLSGLIALLGVATANAADEPPAAAPGEELYFDSLPVVVSVTRLPQTPLELPASVTIIDRRMIEAAGVNDLPELLRLAAGFQIAHVDGTRYAVTYHGMGDDYARRIQVLVDGRSVYLPATSSVDWLDLPLALEDIDHIEVLRGPNGVAFGDNSFSGVVNIITQEAKAAHGSYARVQGGQGNYRRAVVRQGERLGELDLRVTLEHQSDDGLDDAIKKNGNFSSLKDDKLGNKLSLRGDWRAGVNDFVQFHAGFNSGVRGYGYNATTGNPDDYAAEPGFETHNWRHFEQLKWRHIASSDNELQLQFYHDYSDIQARYQTVAPLPPLEVNMNILSERHALELEHRFRMSEALRMVWGGETRFDEVTAPGYLNSDEPLSNDMYRGFAHTEWRPLDDYLVNLGAMLEHNDIAGTHLSPRFAINRRLSAEHAMRISATRAYRTPAIIEEYADYRAALAGDETNYYQLWKSQGSLLSEKITAYEIGWMGSLGGQRNTYDLKLFREELRDIVSHPLWLGYPSPLPATTLYLLNRDWANLKGVEAQLRATASDDTLFSFGYSYVYAEGTYTRRLNPEVVETVQANVPSHTFSWLTEHRFDDHWRGSLAFYHVDHIDFWHETSLNTADVRLAWRFKHDGDEGNLALVARDVMGAYYDYQDERVINPRLYLSLDYRF
ncbi:MAG TPA: TonB-dependent receptor [Gammaproteobacteria bacterium]